MAEIIDLKKYKKQHDIPLPRSPYYTLNATKEEIDEALQRAKEWLSDTRYSPMYAVLVGYKNIKTGKTKLLKEQHGFSTKDTFETAAGIKDHYMIGIVRKAR